MSIDTESLYLKKLKFDPASARGALARYIQNHRLIFLIIMGIFLGGLYSLYTLPRELNPDVNIPIVSVTTALPGASPRDVEDLITTKIEKIAPNLTNLDTYVSQSTDGFSLVTFQFLSTQDLNEATAQVKDQIDLIASDLPEDATDPSVQKLDFNDQPIWRLAIVGNVDRVSLSHIAESIEKRLEDTSGIRRVDLSGNEQEEIVVEVDAGKLAQYGIGGDAIMQTLKGSDISLPAGTITVNGLIYSLSLDNQFTSLESIRSLPIRTGQSFIPLYEVANIYRRSKKTVNFVDYRDHASGRLPAVQLDIYKSEGETITAGYDKAKKIIDEEVKKYPELKAVDVLNFSKEISVQFTDLQGNFTSSIGLIFLALLIFLGLRQASIAALSLPLTLMSAFLIMKITGITLNFLSLFSLLIAVGLVDDDAIVMVQAYTSYRKKFNPLQAALLVYKDFFIPIWTGTLTVVWSFLPMLLASGILGEFIKPIPIVVSATLLSSTAIATAVNLPLNHTLSTLVIPKRVKILLFGLVLIATIAIVSALTSGSPLGIVAVILYIVFLIALYLSRDKVFSHLESRRGGGKRSSTARIKRTFLYAFTAIITQWNTLRAFIDKKGIYHHGFFSVEPIVRRYRNLIGRIIVNKKRRRIVYGVVVGLIALSIIFAVTGLLKQEFFPKSDVESVYINVELPPGYNRDQTTAVLTQVEQRVIDIPQIKQTVSSVGSTFDANSGFGGGSGGENIGNIAILLGDPKERNRSSIDIAEELRDRVEAMTSAKVTVAELSSGPPAGADFQANIKGPDLAMLEKISEDFIAILGSIPGATNPRSSLIQSTGQISVELNQAELAKRGLSAPVVGSWLRTALSGNDISEIVVDGEDRDVTMSIRKDEQSLSYLQNLVLPSQLGSYTLSEVATFTLENSPASIIREDGKRVVRVYAGAAGIPVPELFNQFQTKVKDYQMPSGYSWDVGGANEENIRSTQSIIQAMGISFLLILLTMVLQLGSFRKAGIVLLAIPLATSGVFIFFTLTGTPLSFPALIGVLALFGIVVNNSMMLIEKINQNIEARIPFYDAITDACSSRVEAIFLSSFTTIVGLVPITLSDPLWRGLGGAIIAGLSISGAIILFLLPSIYVEIYKPSKRRV